MANVRLQNLGINLSGNQIISELDLAVDAGEFLVLLGPSGCGKSTLLHAIAGLIDVSAGSIEIAGQDMTWADPSERQIGMVFQSYALYPTMTVEKNMSFGLRINGTPKAEIERRINKVAEMLHLTPLLKRKPAALSGGQRQRVAIGRALVREAEVFLFDEPLSNLDAKLRTNLRRELKLLHQQLQSTMIYVTHDQVEAMTLATRIVVMQAGKIQQIGTPECVYERPVNLFVAGFLGAPAMNFIQGQLDAQQCFVSESLSLDLSSYVFAADGECRGDVVLGVRPEQIQIRDDGQFNGVVTLVEPMGNHLVVWLQAGAQTVSCIVNQQRSFAIGQSVSYGVDTSKISLFDPRTEQRL
ncbi:ABC transporter ATP-binding protein [Undibacterium baiyunense]|uniref:ABC transporter ATP-binding protein n=1 Tax=Undibacterium baiyunense TaxID=2828731 RepID=A0A941I1Z4_9BURK|nr:ABC transporter ATP-binding protein [Undibacterium baiyunense]MBR7745762.1 ABC transporter ATP-binding protein [Undibacterium baiyunense]